MIKQALNKYSSLQKSVKAALWFLICSFITKVLSSITTPLFTRLMTTEEYGQFSVYSSWLSIVTIVVTINLFYGVYIQGLVKYNEDRDEFTGSLQGLFTVLTIVWIVIYLLFQEFWNTLLTMTTVQVLAMLVTIWSTGIFSFWAAEKRNTLSYRPLVVLTVCSTIFKVGLSLVFVIFAEDKVTARIVAIAIVDVVAFTGLYFKKLFTTKKIFSKKFWGYALAFNIPLIPHYLSQTILNSADRIMIDSLVGASEAGIYSLAYSISIIMTFFSAALLQTIQPWLYKKIKNKEFSGVSEITYTLFIGVAILNLILIAFAPEAVAIFAPEEYYDAIWIIPPVAMSVLFMFSYSFFACFEFYYEKKFFIMLSTVVGAVVNIVLNLIFIKLFGYYAAGYTTLVCYMIYAFCHYLAMRKINKDKLGCVKIYDSKILLLIMFVFVCFGFAFLLVYKYMILRYSIIAMIFILMIILRKKIINHVKKVMSLKKEKAVIEIEEVCE